MHSRARRQPAVTQHAADAHLGALVPQLLQPGLVLLESGLEVFEPGVEVRVFTMGRVDLLLELVAPGLRPPGHRRRRGP